jgi:hypothetical protein
MKNDRWDVVKVDIFLEEYGIAIITEIIKALNAYYVIVCGMPERNEILIYDHEIIENITKKQILYQHDQSEKE